MPANIRSYIIYNPVYRRIKKYIKRCGYRNYIVNTWNVCFDKLDDQFDMRLVWVNADDSNFIKFMDKLTTLSNSYHFWTKTPSISCDQKNVDELEEFVRANKLWKYIDKIQTQTRLSLVPVQVKIVTFHPNTPRNILTTFEQPISVEHQRSLFIAEAYEWLTPSGLKHFKKRIRYRHSHLVIYLLLDYYRKRRRRHNIRVLNLFDLCALRLAMFDPRYYQFDQCEIPGLIHTEFRDIVERTKKRFSPIVYLIEQGVQSVPSVVAEYFLVYASDYCNFVSKLDLVSEKKKFLYDIEVDDYVRLYSAELYEEFLIDFIQNRPFLEISVTSQSQAMSSKVLGNIIKFANVHRIDINTNFAVELESFYCDDAPIIEKNIFLVFYGDGEINNIQNYVQWLKPVCKFRKISLFIRCPVVDYSIFNDVGAKKITFMEHEINSKMISDLQKTELKTTKYVWEKATLQKHVDILKTLHEFQLVKKLKLVLDETTFQSVFNFIEGLFLEHDRTELEFGGDLIKFNIIIPVDDYRTLDLSEYTFKLNRDRFKIEMFDKKTKKVIDLYDILCETDGGNEPEDFYDFYQ